MVYHLTLVLSLRRKTWLRRKANRVAPLKGHTSDDYDSTDHRRRRLPASQQSRRIKLGRNQRARPLTRLVTTGRMSRRVAVEAQKELAWMDTGMGVQLMKVQPVQVSVVSLKAQPSYNKLKSD